MASLFLSPQVPLHSHAIRPGEALLTDRAATTATDQREPAILRVKQFVHGRFHSPLGSLMASSGWKLTIPRDRVQIQLYEIRTITVLISRNCTGAFSPLLYLPKKRRER